MSFVFLCFHYTSDPFLNPPGIEPGPPVFKTDEISNQAYKFSFFKIFAKRDVYDHTLELFLFSVFRTALVLRVGQPSSIFSSATSFAAIALAATVAYI